MGRCSILFQAVAAGWVGGKGRTYEKGRMKGSFRNKLGKELWVAGGFDVGELGSGGGS